MDGKSGDQKRILSLRKKLILVVMLVGLVPLVIATGVSYGLARSSLEEDAFDKLEAVRDARIHHIQDTYGFIRTQVLSLRQDSMVIDAAREFHEAFDDLPTELGWEGAEGPVGGKVTREQATTAVRSFYVEVFARRYEEATGRPAEAEDLMPTDARALALQHLYIASNPRGFGAKKLMDRPEGDQTTYGSDHLEYHPVFREFMEAFGYYDLFLVDESGVVVYSVEKEVDLGTDLLKGPLRGSGLADVTRKALKSNRDDMYAVSDYVAYRPSLEEPAAFIAVPLEDDGRRAGALVLQMPIERINGVMNRAAGLGRTGETYLVGPDKTLRSTMRTDPEREILGETMDTASVRDALAGNEGHGIVKCPDGHEVLTAWSPLDVIGLHYAFIAELDAEEALAPAQRLFRWMLGLTAALALIALLVSWWVTGSLAAPIDRVTNRLEGVAEHLLSSSQEQQAGAAEQSTAVEETRQTFQGLLETSANLNTIGDEVLGHAEISQRSAQTIGSRIRDLSTHAAQITEILTLVKEIANRSEILALNAALEGTKAGEAGRGFSLVAQQMQRLAEQVMGSVKRIEALTADISQASSGAVLAAEEAEKVSQLTTQSARSITGATGLQQSSAEQVSVAMNEIAQVAQQNVDAARNVVTSSNELLSLAERLRTVIGSRR